MKKILLFLTLSILTSCGRYHGHNRYYFFWLDFERQSITSGKADLDNDGIITKAELLKIEHKWVKDKGLQLYKCELYKDGKYLPPVEAAKLAGLIVDKPAK